MMRDHRIPFASSLLVHIILLALLLVGWDFTSRTETLKTPPYIEARLVKLTAEAGASKPVVIEKPQPKEEEPLPEIERLDQRDLEIQKQQKQRLEKQKQEKLRQEKLKKEKLLEEKQKQQAEEKRQREESLRRAEEMAAAEKRKADQELAQALANEQALRQSQADAQMAQSYVDMIRRRVEQNWSRPPSAKQGMEVLLEIQLVPTGYVTGVSVLRGSGNPSFDLSAQQAVRKADRFPEIKDVPPRVFEKHFRRFQMLFRLEDKL